MEESPEGDAALAGDLLMEEDCEWAAGLGAALAPPPREPPVRVPPEHPVLCEMIGGPITQPTKLNGEPIKGRVEWAHRTAACAPGLKSSPSRVMHRVWTARSNATRLAVAASCGRRVQGLDCTSASERRRGVMRIRAQGSSHSAAAAAGEGARRERRALQMKALPKT